MLRKFKIAKGFENDGVILPKRETVHSAGYDLASIEDCVIKSHDIYLIKTGLKVLMPDNEFLAIYARSSLSRKKGLMLANSVGIIDKDYYENADNDGHILISVYNFTDKDVFIGKGEKIAQGIFQRYFVQDNENASAMKIRTGGFGSTSNE